MTDRAGIWGGVVVDVVMVSEAVAGMLAAGGVPELSEAAGGGTVTQQVRAGRDAYVAGHDQTVTNYPQPGE